MTYVDMARSHVKECLREGFELSRLVVDEDGDVPFTAGTAVYYVTVRTDGKKVKVWSTVVVGVKATVALLREVNAVNMSLEGSRMFVAGNRIVLEGVLPVDGLTPETLRELCLEVGNTADEVGTMISAVHGGEVSRPEGSEGCSECGGELPF
jgi:hypothetical protein